MLDTIFSTPLSEENQNVIKNILKEDLVSENLSVEEINTKETDSKKIDPKNILNHTTLVSPINFIEHIKKDNVHDHKELEKIKELMEAFCTK